MVVTPRCPVANQPAAHDQLARGADHAERAVRHAELALVDVRGGIDFELVTDATHLSLQLDRHAVSARVQLTADLQVLALEPRIVGSKSDDRVMLGVKEINRAQVLVARLVLCVEAGRLDRQVNRRVTAQIEGAVIALEATFDGHQPPERRGTELDARTCWIDPPARFLDVGATGVLGGDGFGVGGHQCLLFLFTSSRGQFVSLHVQAYCESALPTSSSCVECGTWISRVAPTRTART